MAARLPKKSREYIEALAKVIRDEAKGRLAKTVRLLNDTVKNYGFEENLRLGVYAPLPGLEPVTSNCFGDAVDRFFIAQSLGLEPRFFTAYGLKVSIDDLKKRKNDGSGNDLESILSRKKSHENNHDHSFIFVNLKNRKIPYILDPQLDNYGSARLDKQNKRINIITKRGSRLKTLSFDQLIELNDEEILRKIRYLNTAEGSISVLEAGQRIGQYRCGKDSISLYVQYHKKENSIEVQVRHNMPVVTSEAFINRIVLDKDSNLKSEAIEYEFYSANHQNWMDLSVNLSLGKYPSAEVRKYWSALKESVKVLNKRPSRYLKKNRVDFIRNGLKENGLCGLLKKSDIDQSVGLLYGKNEHNLDIHKFEELASLSVLVEQNFSELLSDNNKINDAETLVFVYVHRLVYNNFLEKLKSKGADKDGYIHSEHERMERIRAPKVIAENLNARVKALEDMIEEKHMGINLDNSDKSVTEIWKEYKKVLYEFSEANASYTDNVDLLSFFPERYHKVSDMSLLFDGKENKEVKTLIGRFDNDKDGFIKDHRSGLFDVYCILLENMMVESLKYEKYLRLREFFPMIQKKIKAYHEAVQAKI